MLLCASIPVVPLPWLELIFIHILIYSPTLLETGKKSFLFPVLKRSNYLRVQRVFRTERQRKENVKNILLGSREKYVCCFNCCQKWVNRIKGIPEF